MKPGAASVAAGNLATLEPGKTTLVQQQAIGNRYIEGKSYCETEGGGTTNCFLPPEVRGRLVSAYQREVRIAETFYVQALGEIGLERLIDKEEELPAILTLAMDMLGGYVGAVVARSVVKLRNAPPRDLLAAVDAMTMLQSTGNDGASPGAVKALLNMTSESSLEAQVKILMKGTNDLGKRGAKKIANADVSGDARVDELKYVDELKAAAAVSFQRLDQEFPGDATDGQLIAAFHAFKAEMGHDVPTFKAALKAKIARYQATVAKIGRAGLPLQVPLRPGEQPQLEPQQKFLARRRDTQVAWVVLIGDPVPRLYYAKVDYEYEPQSAHAALDDKFVLTRPVELEFVNSAVLRHQEKWGGPPPTRMMSREDLARETGDVSVLVTPPHFELSPTRRARGQAPATSRSTTSVLANSGSATLAQAAPGSASAAATQSAKPSVADAAVDVPPLLGVIP